MTTISEYEKSGGFKEELGYCRTIGQAITALREQIPARPHNDEEVLCLDQLNDAHRALHAAILKTRNS